MKFKDLTNQVFGRLTVLYPELVNASGSYKWLCQCICGNTKIVLNKSLLYGRTLSCGCLNKEIIAGNSFAKKHGISGTKLYRARKSMIERIDRPQYKDYKDYGGRGIKMCLGLRQDFFNIVSEPLTPRHSIDRIDNNMNYSCGNCNECLINGWILNIRWATPLQQSNNRRSCSV
jgi:hypothetical protein